MVVLIGGSVPEPCARGGDRPAGHSRSSNQINQKNQTDKMNQIGQMDQLPATRREIFRAPFHLPEPVFGWHRLCLGLSEKRMSPVDTFGEEA